MVLLEIKLELNLATVIAFFSGLIAGFLLLLLIYIIACLSTLKKEKKKLNKELKNITQEDIKNTIINHKNLYLAEKKKRKDIAFDYFFKSIGTMIQEIAAKFYPDSKYPIAELTISESMLLARYIIDKIETLFSHKIVGLLKPLKISQALKLIDTKNKIEDTKVVKTAKKYKLSKVTDYILTILNFLNPATWINKIMTSINNGLLKKVFFIMYDIVGQETYKIYSKQAFIEDNDELEKLLDELNNEDEKNNPLN